ncbi:MAG: GTPase domain-containing protein [Thermoguttaceae bacterium]|nr:GTPase domain-containing protein [Thermoguttaceae bacterium]
MSINTPVVQRLQVLAEMDAVTQSLRDWIAHTPHWSGTSGCSALMNRLLERMDLFRARIESPLVIATFGGTGVGKSQLVQAIIGKDVVKTGRMRPTTRRPTLITAPGLSVEQFGIPPENVEHLVCDSTVMNHLAVIDCPDPDTTDTPGDPRSNLEMLRTILPHCDVLLVATTQQKYRDSRVHEELLAAASGVRFVFVQTHADVDEDIRDDWRQILPPGMLGDRIFFVDSISAFESTRQGEAPSGDFALLLEFLRHELAGTAATRIRRENFWELVMEALDTCRIRLNQGMPKLERLEHEIAETRRMFAATTAERLREELLAYRRPWEHRLVGQALDCWGASPLQTVFRGFHQFGDLAFSSLLLRARSPAQLALLGAAGSVRKWKQNRENQEADQIFASNPEFWGWDPVKLRETALAIEGFCYDAGVRDAAGERFAMERLARDASQSAQNCTELIATRVQRLLERLASRNSGFLTRLTYETLFWCVTILLLARPAKNFFFDSWLSNPPQPLLGLDFYLLTLAWFLLGCFLMYLHFSRRLRRGLQREINAGLQISQSVSSAPPHTTGTPITTGLPETAWPELFGSVERACVEIREYSRELDRIIASAEQLKRTLETTSPR